MEKSIYVKPVAENLLLESYGLMDQVGSKTVDPEAILGKQTGFEENDDNAWGGYGPDFTQNWMTGDIHRSWDEE